MSNIEKRKSSELAPGAPQKGFEEGVNQEDLIMPRIKLIQAMSPEAQDEGIKPGTIINGLSKQEVSMKFIPINVHANWVRFNPRNSKDPNFNPDYEPGAMIWASSDPNDARVVEEGRFGENGERPLATKFLTFLCLFDGDTSPVLLSFSNTSLKAGKQLLSMAKFSKRDMFATRYTLTAHKETKDGNQYFVYKVQSAGLVSDKEYKQCEQLWKEFSIKKPTVAPTEEEAVPF